MFGWPRANPLLNALQKRELLGVLACVLACAFILTAARAQQIATGLICDTQAELEAIVAKVNETSNLETALAKVNVAHPAKNHACGIGRVAFFKGKTNKTSQTVDGLRDIVEITVVAGVTPDGVRAIRPVEQFTLFKSEGEGL